jgi:VanZ family protein
MRLMSRLAIGYTVLIAYATLYSLSGWRDNGVPLFTFVFAAWPRYYTSFDLIVNVLGYIPFGLLVFASLQGRQGKIGASATWLLTCAAGLLLSLTLETLQNFLPSRTPSNLDLICNTIGAVLGASFARWLQPRLLEAGYLGHLRQRYFLPSSDAGLVLLALWLLTQLEPTSLMFGTGDVRRLVDLPAAQHFSPDGFRAIESIVAGAATLAVGLIALQLPRQPRFAFVVMVLSIGLCAKAASLAIVIRPEAALSWLTEGNSIGFACGFFLLWLARRLVDPAQRAVAALALLIATVTVNLAPDNPYLDHMLQVWNPGQFLNFHGLTQFAASLWPFFALPWLMIYRREAGRV